MPQLLASCYEYLIAQVLAALRARGSEVDAGLPQQAMQAEMAAFLVMLHFLIPHSILDYGAHVCTVLLHLLFPHSQSGLWCSHLHCACQNAQ